MSRCLNRATLVGSLAADPEIRTLPGGSRVAQIVLGTSRRWNDRDGKPKEKTQWHRITVWDSLPSTFAFVETYVRKGDRVFVEGEIDYHSYEDRDGVVRWSTEIRASEVLAAGELSGGGGRRTARKSAASDAAQTSAL